MIRIYENNDLEFSVGENISPSCTYNFYTLNKANAIVKTGADVVDGIITLLWTELKVLEQGVLYYGMENSGDAIDELLTDYYIVSGVAPAEACGSTVNSVNGKKGDVVLTAQDVGAASKEELNQAVENSVGMIDEDPDSDYHGEVFTLYSTHGTTMLPNRAPNLYATAFGLSTLASGQGSFAMGDNTIASGPGSFASGVGNIANAEFMTAFGRFAQPDTLSESEIENPYQQPQEAVLFVIGNGTADVMNSDEEIKRKRNDAFRLLYNGKLYIQGIGGFTGKELNRTEAMNGIKTIQEVISDIQTSIDGAETKINDISVKI